MYGSNCKGAEDEGVSILHGNRGVYHDNKQPAFKVVYDAIHDVSILVAWKNVRSLLGMWRYQNLRVGNTSVTVARYGIYSNVF